MSGVIPGLANSLAAALLGLALVTPWLLLVLLAWRPGLLRLALPLAPLPLLLGVAAPPATASMEALLLGARFATDEPTLALRLLAGLGWLLGGLYAAGRGPSEPRFGAFWLATLGGQSLALLAGDLASFYLGYVTMTLAAWGLVVHARTAEAWRAGRIYLVLALAGEALLLAGLLALGARFGNASLPALPALLAADGAGAAAPLLLAGFAVKLGIVPLHLWLPLAHPVAPVPASAVLSGVIVKAGLLGWLRFLPAEAFGPALPVTALLLLGLLTAFWGVAAGLLQRRLKTVLAYSTISQMGLVLAAFVATLAAGGGGAMLGLVALHHGLNKIALFLAAGSAVGHSRWRVLLFALPALSLAGLPLTSGALAKSALKDALYASEAGWMSLPLALGSAATLLLMIKAFRLARRERAADTPLHPAWLLAVITGLVVPWAWAQIHGLGAPWSAAALWDGIWPLLLAALLWWTWRWLPGASARRRLELPEGDLLAPLERLVLQLGALWQRGLPRFPRWNPSGGRVHAAGKLLREAERRLLRLPVTGMALLLTLALLWLLAR